MKPILLAAAFALACGAASAQAPPQAPNPDLDHDGKVTLDEFRRIGQGGFMARVDVDKDGRISRSEFDAVARRMEDRGGGEGAARAAAMWAGLDANKDGFVGKAEREAAELRRFQAADTNHDGWLSKGELLMMRQNRARGG
jgi:Ca2+-binding EF-hand superfamily protein